ncbi:ABC transporter substrate-binding protein [Antarcticirhabdus aurantiaca]|uniref:ABC transporter substrate-binding protein n=1 Tax=Antarcticirhabdus aurantiaca TaxID=2606717 RepID=A0ACD4NN95_9HYPH|nr:ABC transporter substrate-binding protein [Antarcticirhabdus aurantiaca]WAJ28349.1 ABC transporter substrate-binding protein [Jeongeuplla avenae]
MKAALRLLGALTTSVALLATPLAAEAGTLRLGMTTWVGYGPLFLARDLGYFKEGGLDVELNLIEDTALYMAGVASGDLDGSASTVDELMKYRSSDFCFNFVVALDDSSGGDGVLVGEGVNSLADLKGTQVGLNEGAVSEFWFDILLKREGMSLSDVQVLNMTADDAAAAFIAGRIPAAVTWEPHLSLVRAQNKGKVLVDSSATPGVIVDVVQLRCDVIEKQPEDVKALVAGLYRANEYIKSNPQEAYEIMAKGVGGYLSEPAAFAEAAKGVTFYDKERNVAFWGTAEQGPLSDLIKLGNEILGGSGALRQPGSYAELVSTQFVRGE